MTALRFAFPDGTYKNIVTGIITAVPWDWSCVNGKLEASGLEEPNATSLGFRIGSDRGITVFAGEATGRESGYIDFVVNRPTPRFIIFDDAGFPLAQPTLETCKRIACSYVLRGYRGRLTFQHEHGASQRKVRICFEEGCMWVDIIADPQSGFKGDIVHLLEVCASFNLTSEPLPRSELIG